MIVKKAVTLFNFYVIVGDTSEPTLRSVPIDRAMQQDLTAHINRLRLRYRTDDSDVIDYDPGYRPESGELFRAKKFTLPAELGALVVSAPTLQPLTDDDLERGDARALLAVGQGANGRDGVLVFQSIDSRQVLRRSRLAIVLSGSVFTRLEGAGMVIRDVIDAVFEGGDLYFASEHVVRRFLDISGLFEAATKDEVQAFVGHKLFAVDNPAVVAELADQWIRRKIKMLASSNMLDTLGAKKVAERAKRFGFAFPVKRSRLVMPEDRKTLKILLKFLDDDYFQSDLSDSQFVVNSKRPWQKDA